MDSGSGERLPAAARPAEHSPFRTVVRSSAAAVDRHHGRDRRMYMRRRAWSLSRAPGCGLSCGIADEAARERLGSTDRRRHSACWRIPGSADGAAADGVRPKLRNSRGAWPGLLLPKLARALSRNGGFGRGGSTEPPLYWLLSLFAPRRRPTSGLANGDYQHASSAAACRKSRGAGKKQRSRMVAEGSVLAAPAEPVGTAVDVAPEGFAHPVYRSGTGVSLELPAFAGGSGSGTCGH